MQVSTNVDQLSWELSHRTERQTPPRCRTDGGGIAELSSWQRADLWLVGLAEAEIDRRAEFKGSSEACGAVELWEFSP